MGLVDEYEGARAAEDAARLRRAVALREMVATGMTQREIADAVHVSQPAVGQQLKSAPDPAGVEPSALMTAATPVLRALVEERGYSRLALFGSLAHGEGRRDSDIDLIVRVHAAHRPSISSNCMNSFGESSADPST
jgi:hypothetical protein